MAKKEQLWRGKTQQELQSMDMMEFAKLVASRERRKLTRGLTEQEKIFMRKIQKGEQKLKTHCRDMIVMPIMLGKTIQIFTGKEYVQLNVEIDMLGHRLGEFAITRKTLQHSAPGVGATRSSAAISMK